MAWSLAFSVPLFEQTVRGEADGASILEQDMDCAGTFDVDGCRDLRKSRWRHLTSRHASAMSLSEGLLGSRFHHGC